MRERLAHISLRLGPPFGVGLVLGLIGPFGTYHLLPLGTRLAYWLAVVSVNWLLADAIVRRVAAVLDGRVSQHRLIVPLAGTLLAALPATGVVSMGNGLSGIGWPQNVVLLFGQVTLLLAAITLPVYTWQDMRERMLAQPELPISATSTSMPYASKDGTTRQVSGGLALFLARFPKPLGGQLLCLEMQDHYLVVHHSGGSEMILCRMEDAARELGGLGMRVHRSWWVARDAVTGVEREGQRTLIRLTDNRSVPVGRSFRPDLKAAGWL
jgi:hypothetical protein